MKKKFLQYIFPSMCSFLLTGIYSVIDGIFVGNAIGDNGLAAINIVWPLIAPMAALGTGIGMGTSVLMSLNLGAGKDENAKRAEGTGITMLLLAGLMLFGVLFFFGEPLLKLLGANGEVLTFGMDYLHYCLAGCFIQVFATGTLPIMRNLGASFFAMFAMTAGCCTNIFLDWLFIFQLRLGLKGAAVATVCGQLVTLLFCLYFHLKKEHRIPLSYLKPDHYWKSIIKIGISPFGLTYLPAVTILFMNLQTLKYGGTEAVSAYAVLAYVLSFLELVIQGISDGSQPLLSYDCGKKDYRSLRTYARWTFLLAFSFGIVGGTFIYLFRDVIPVIYGTSKATAMVIAQAAPAFGIVMLMYGFTKSTVSYLYATNRTTLSSIMVYGEVVLTITFIFVLPLFLGLNGVWYTMPTVQLILVIVGIVFRLHTQKELSANA